MATEGYKQKVNVVLTEKLYDDVITFGLKNDMKFSECVRESEKLYGSFVLSSENLKKNKGRIKKQAKFKKKEYLRIKQTVDINHITIKVYLTACLEFMVYGNSREL